jgi:hypothetical protein
LKGKKRIQVKNTVRARLSLCLLLALFSGTVGAAGTISFTPYLDYDSSSNIFWDTLAISDNIISPGLELSLNTRKFNFFLDAGSRIYQSNDYLNQTTFSGGFNYYGILSKRISLFLSPEFSLTQFKGDMAYLNTTIPSLTIGLKHMLSSQLYGRIGFNLRFSNYQEENSYDRWRAALFAELSAFFKTQTTLRLTLGINYLYFPHIAMEAAAVASSTPLGQTASMTSSATEIRRRRGVPDPPAPAPSDPSPEPDPVDPQPEPESPLNTIRVDLAIPQSFIILRAAQSLGYKTGLIAEVQYRKNRELPQGFDPLTIDEWALQRLDEDFFWQGTRLSLAFKTEAVLNLEIAVDFSYYMKEYNGLNALDMEGDPIQPGAFREDRLSQATMKVAKSLNRFAFYLSGSYRKNLSNDLYFQYDFYTISAGIDYSF